MKQMMLQIKNNPIPPLPAYRERGPEADGQMQSPCQRQVHGRAVRICGAPNHYLSLDRTAVAAARALWVTKIQGRILVNLSGCVRIRYPVPPV